MTEFDCYIDFKSPAAYLALQPTLDLAREFGIEINWHPYRTLQKAVPQIRADESKGETHIRVREIARREMHLKYAGLRGLPMEFPDTPGNTDLALAALLSLSAHHEQFIKQAFQLYWVEHADLNEEATVAHLLRKCGATELSAAEHWLEQLESQQLATEELGVVDTPGYVLEGQIFIGREHMPLLRERLTERLDAL